MSSESCRIGVIGEFNERNKTHRATNDELSAAGASFEWVRTDAIGDPGRSLSGFDGLFITPGSPYADMRAALDAIRYAREEKVPLTGTCGGFQHVVVEFARHVLGIDDADHAETNPNAERLAITPLVCSLVGQSHPVQVLSRTRAAAIYGVESVTEPYYCNYGMNPDLEPRLAAAGLHVSGRDEGGGARIVELEGHPFFLATLYVFQARDRHDPPHPLTAAFLHAARSHRPSSAPREDLHSGA